MQTFCNNIHGLSWIKYKKKILTIANTTWFHQYWLNISSKFLFNNLKHFSNWSDRKFSANLDISSILATLLTSFFQVFFCLLSRENYKMKNKMNYFSKEFWRKMYVLITAVIFIYVFRKTAKNPNYVVR